jgi:C_GCAxxG_C_C family probable redox protein
VKGKQERIEKVSQKAGDYEELSINCAQGTIAALAEEFGFSAVPELIKAASFFPGVSQRKETCGAVLGGLMACGMALGRDKLYDPSWSTPEALEEWMRRREVARTFCERFKKRWGSTMCGEIRPKVMGRDYDTMTPEGRKQFMADGGPKKCRVPAEFAARLVAELLLEEEE